MTQENIGAVEQETRANAKPRSSAEGGAVHGANEAPSPSLAIASSMIGGALLGAAFAGPVGAVVGGAAGAVISSRLPAKLLHR